MSRALLITIGLFAAGCGDEQLARLTAIKDEVCACKTAACGEAALARVSQQEIASNRQTRRIARAMLDCLAKIYDRDRPDTDPDAEAPAGAPATP
jgi:hypothetical protein